MKVLIVDDEPRHRRGMANMIHALRPEDQVLVAKDGAEALEFVRSEKPDVVLTDIRMPNLDGLSFLKLLEDEGLRTKVVMISAYNLFEYAQTAIRHGAYDYLLKPVDAEKVEDVLRRLEDQLAAEFRQHSESEALKHRLSLTSSAYRNGLFLSWLNGSLTDTERQELEALEEMQGSGMVVFSEFRFEPGPQAEWDPAAWLRRLEQAWAEFGEANTFSLNAPREDVCQAVTIVRTSRPAQERKLEIRQMAASLGTEWAKYGRFTHGIGPDCRSLWMEAPQAYRAAQTAHQYNFHDRWEGIVFQDELLSVRDPVLPDGEKLFEALQGRDAEAAVEMCRAAFVQLAADGHAAPNLIKECAALTLMKIKSRIRDYVDRRIGSVLTHSALDEVPSCRAYTDLMAILETRLREVHDAIRQSQSDKSERIVDECLRWIQENAKEELTLERAAEHFFFNASYFSTLIKSRTGKTFSDHVTEARMRRARELLAANRRIYEVAAECGYQDTKYFCRVFKKQNGMSPEAYKHTSFPQRSGEG
ncbi:response regulator [Cohnella zeiphila]|uniref:Response regulator n=1 Tax=Cohnella zeiphila TaxID=2761120 RepID=A0A7X0VY69_9BACL|nr:response regulator [Cohnella zeiphila]MBB6734182.1 response regulator [Cohnella zeiphila]